MNKYIKVFLNRLCKLITVLINGGMKFVCSRECHRMWPSPPKNITSQIKKEYADHKRLLKKYGFKPVKREFLVFRDYLSQKGNNPVFIVPAYIVHRYLTALLNPIQFNAYFEDKNMFDRILPKRILPKTILRRMDEKWYDSDYNILSVEEMKSFLTTNTDVNSIIVKPARDSSSGRGIKLFKYENGTWRSLSDSDTLIHFVESTSGKSQDLILQEVIEQSKFFSRLCDTSVNTLRVVIYNSPIDNMIHNVWTGLRIGAKGSLVDNIHAGGLMFGVDESGMIASYGANQYGEKFEILNSINFASEHLVIPHYHEIIEFVKSKASMLLPHRFIAFDVAVTKEETPVIIEYNLRGYGGWACQFAGDYMFGDKTDEILTFLSKNKRNVEKVFYKIN